jgi:sporulation protein YlmC with PRC-barrel domain
MRLQLGSVVHCPDGVYGELADVVIDPLKRQVTHLVVAPHHRHDLARLVPVEHAHGRAPSDREELITHLVLEHGHLWGKQEITIPIKAVASINNDEVQLTLSKDQVADLKPVPVQRWSS